MLASHEQKAGSPKYRDKPTAPFAAGMWVKELQTFKEQAERRLNLQKIYELPLASLTSGKEIKFTVVRWNALQPEQVENLRQ